MVRAGLFAISVVALLFGPLPGARAELAEVALTIDNQDAGPLRCVAVLAHFVSHDLPVVAPGGQTTLVMLRDSADGSLSLSGHDGRRMMLENLLCGRVGTWTATRGEVPILPVRAMTARALETHCRIDDRLSCSQPGPPSVD